MNELARPMRRNRLIRIANLLADHERATPLARRVLECRLSLVEAELIPTAEEADCAGGVMTDTRRGGTLVAEH